MSRERDPSEPNIARPTKAPSIRKSAPCADRLRDGAEGCSVGGLSLFKTHERIAPPANITKGVIERREFYERTALPEAGDEAGTDGLEKYCCAVMSPEPEGTREQNGDRRRYDKQRPR